MRGLKKVILMIQDSEDFVSFKKDVKDYINKIVREINTSFKNMSGEYKILNRRIRKLENKVKRLR